MYIPYKSNAIGRILSWDVNTELNITVSRGEGCRSQADTRIYSAVRCRPCPDNNIFPPTKPLHEHGGWHPSILRAPRKELEPVSFLWHLTQNKTDAYVFITKALEGRHSVCHIPGSWWLFSFAHLRRISMALLLAQNGDCAGRDGGESFLVTLFLRVYKYSLAGAGSSHKMATHASLPPAVPSLLTSLPAQQIPIINPSLWKPGVIQIHLLQCLIHPLLQDTGFRVFYEMHFTAFIIQDILQHFMAAFYKILSNIM